MKLFWRLPSALRETLDHFFQQNSERLETDPEDSVGLLNGAEKQHAPPSPLHRNFAHSGSRKTWLYLALFGIVLILIASALPAKRVTGIELPFVPATPALDLRQEDRFFHIVIPQIWSPLESVELCKTVLSAGALGYPTPWTAGWNLTIDEDGQITNKTLDKVARISRWLTNMPEDRVDDIVAILGNSKSWFQVRPEVLLKRYFDVLENGNKQLANYYSAEDMESRGIEQKIVFATETACPSNEGSDCQAVEAGDKSVHYLSAGFAIGPIRDMKPLWQRAADRALELTVEDATFDEHAIFTSLLVEQEQHRQQSQARKRQEEQQLVEEDGEDFGIALDFRRELSYATPRDTDDVEWVKHLKTNRREARKWTSPPDMYLPKDIAASTPPFWTVDGAAVPQNTTWHDVQLLTGTSANVVPAVIQRGPSSDPMLATTWWEKMWSQPWTRRLFDTFVLTPIMPVAILTAKDGNETRYWNPHWQKAGVMVAEILKFTKWNDMCNSEQMAGSLFVDGLGLWVDPRP